MVFVYFFKVYLFCTNFMRVEEFFKSFFLYFFEGFVFVRVFAVFLGYFADFFKSYLRVS
jgi:hypothetical protein